MTIYLPNLRGLPPRATLYNLAIALQVVPLSMRILSLFADSQQEEASSNENVLSRLHKIIEIDSSCQIS